MFYGNKSVVAILFNIFMVVMVCQMAQANEAENYRNRPVAYEAMTQREAELSREVEMLRLELAKSQEIERLRQELAKSQEAKAASYRNDNNEAAQTAFMVGGIILALAFGAFMIWTIIEMPPTVA